MLQMSGGIEGPQNLSCVQAVSVVLMEKQDEKHLLTFSLNSINKPTRLDGVGLARLTNLLQMQERQGYINQGRQEFLGLGTLSSNEL